MMRIDHIRIGETDNGHPVFISKAAGNHHISVTGMSGFGKTVWLTYLETWLASKGATVIVLDYADTHSPERMSSPWKSDFERLSQIVDINRDGIPFSLWLSSAFNENRHEDSLAALDIVSNAAGLSPMQQACLFHVLEHTDCHPAADSADELDSLLTAAEEYAESCPANEMREIRRICSKIAFMAKSVKIVPKQILNPGKISILKVNYGDRTGLAVCDMILDLLWQDIRSRAPGSTQDTFLILDEYQHLDLIHNHAPLPNILREGRRYGLSVILSTQTLSGLTAKENALIQQAATKIHFRQTKKDAFAMTKGLPDKERQPLANTLTSLKVGQCCAEGIFAIDGMQRECMVPLVIRKRNRIQIAGLPQQKNAPRPEIANAPTRCPEV